VRNVVYILSIFTLISGVLYWQLEPSTKGSAEGESETEFEQRALNTLPYLNWAPVDKDKNLSGVTKFNKEKAYSGLNFYNSTTVVKASLMDMDGKEVYSWTPKIAEKAAWQHAHLLTDGSLLVVAKDKYLAKIGWDSSVIWMRPGRYHHEVSSDADGKIYTLRREEKLISDNSKQKYPIVDDRIEIFSPKGELLTELSVFELVRKHMKLPMMIKAYNFSKNKKLLVPLTETAYKGKQLWENSSADILHTNTVSALPRTVFEGCQKGDLLISVRNIDLIGCVDLSKKALRWQWGQKYLSRQHHPNLLANGNFLIFNNRPRKRLSEIVEFNPATQKVVWNTTESAPRFYSFTRGSAQRLPNGNTLFAESDFGRVLEVTMDQELVWEYYNTETYYRERSKEDRRGTFYRFSRLEPELQAKILPLLKSSTKK
jgi:outer membrane protein assembly factor BamB